MLGPRVYRRAGSARGLKIGGWVGDGGKDGCIVIRIRTYWHAVSADTPRRRRKGIREAEAGASGDEGGELLRLLLGHPGLELAALTAGGSAGSDVAATHPQLPQLAGRTFAATDAAALADADVAFLALPHGESAALAARLPDELTVIDLGADFRLADAAAWDRYYGGPKVGAEVDHCQLVRQSCGQGGGLAVRQGQEGHVGVGQRGRLGGGKGPAGQLRELRVGGGHVRSRRAAGRERGQLEPGVAEQQPQQLAPGVPAGAGHRCP